MSVDKVIKKHIIFTHRVIVRYIQLKVKSEPIQNWKNLIVSIEKNDNRNFYTETILIFFKYLACTS